METKTEKDLILNVRISAASKTVWEGEAYSVTSKNSSGDFDILGMHSNFITLIRNEPIVVKMLDGTDKKYDFKQSVILVTDNEVKIFADIPE